MSAGVHPGLSPGERARRRLLLGLAWTVNRIDAATPPLEVTTHNLQIRDLPLDLDGFTLAHVSDLHVGPGSWLPARWKEAADAVERVRPHLVVNTGDFLQWEPPPAKARSVFERFLARASGGGTTPHTIAILGNHDYYAGEDSIQQLGGELRGEGVDVLTNESTCLSVGRAVLTVVGLSKHRPGMDDAIEALICSRRPRIVLIHEPDLAGWIPAGAADLVLAGHTHGGQVTFPHLEPFIVRRFCDSRYVEGWYRVNDNPMYVNRGLGCTGYPVRFRARPEVSFIRLAR